MDTLDTEYQRQFSDKISGLQERHIQMVRQTTDELEQLKRELTGGGHLAAPIEHERGPLLAEIHELRGSVIKLEQERWQQSDAIRELRAEFAAYQDRIKGSVDAFCVAIRSQPLPAPLPLLERPSEPIPAAPAIPKKPKISWLALAAAIVPSRQLILRSVTACLVTVVGYVGISSLVLRNPPSSQASDVTGAVQGVSTEPIQMENPESFAEVSFADTVWDTSVDADYGISIEYPKNASTRMRIIGGSNLWFLRKYGYLLKISKFEVTTGDSLDQWWEKNQAEYNEGYSYAKGTFKGYAAWVGKPVEKSGTSGTQYFFKRSNVIFLVWVKDEDGQSDDGQRILHMMETLKFTN